MDRVVVDTDVFSYFLKRDTRRRLYEPALAQKELCLSFMSLAEIKRWPLERRWGERKNRILADATARYIVLPFDATMTDRWAEITVHRNRLGKPIACGDCWIAATCVRYGFPLVTHNSAHYMDIPGLTLISKGTSPRP